MYPRLVLDRQQDLGHPHRFVILILHDHHGLAVGADAIHRIGHAGQGQQAGKTMGDDHGHGHQFGRFVAGVADHDTLVTGTDGLVIFVAVRGHFHGPGDVRALGMKIAIDLEALGIIPHAVQHVPGNVEHIGVCFGSDLSGHNDMTAGGHDLTGDAAGRVTGQTRIQNIVCDEVAEFVGVAFGDRFGRIKSSHSFLLCLLM